MGSSLSQRKTSFLLFSIFVTASCALVYELLIASICSYFLGDSVKHFSLVIGIFIFSMGVGSYLSRYIYEDLLFYFFNIEVILGITGALSIPLLYAAFAWTNFFAVAALLFTFIIGTMIGFEIPLVTRALSSYFNEEKNISNVLSLDYLGGLVATLLFPFVFVPYLGLYKTCLITGLMNIAVGILGFQIFTNEIEKSRRLLSSLLITLFSVLIISSLFFSKKMLGFWESSLYKDSVIVSEQSHYQKIVVTAKKKDIRLYLNGSLQFSSLDEYRYHESLVHIPMGLAKRRRDVLILGGGDGLAVREILKYGEVNSLTLVDLDKMVTDLSKKNRHISEINRNSLEDKRVTIINEDAFKFLIDSNKKFDVILADLPDPHDVALAKLYSREFYKLALKNLNPDGIFTGQSTSPFYSKDAFWCIKQSMEAAGFSFTYPYHVNIPSFGEWGFLMASRAPLHIDDFKLPVKTKFLTNDISHMFYFEKDIEEIPLTVSSLDRPTVLAYYLNGWDKYK